MLHLGLSAAKLTYFFLVVHLLGLELLEVLLLRLRVCEVFGLILLLGKLLEAAGWLDVPIVSGIRLHAVGFGRLFLWRIVDELFGGATPFCVDEGFDIRGKFRVVVAVYGVEQLIVEL